MPTPSIQLRPGVANRNQWQGAERKNAVTPKIRKVVLARDDNTCASCGHRAMKWMHIHHIAEEDNDALENLATLCPACHAIMHFGRSMQWGTLEIWKADLPQVEIVRATREGIRRGLSLQEVKSTFKLEHGRLPPDSMDWPNELLNSMAAEPRAELPEPLCAVFIEFSRWQLDA